MTASWTDPEKGKTSGIVTGFENPKDLTFKRNMAYGEVVY
jgi:hypothetical protein